jgi:hypothetical protein
MGGFAAGACSLVGSGLITFQTRPPYFMGGSAAGACRFVGSCLIEARHTGRSVSNPT